MTADPLQWCVVLPVKGGTGAKSRLAVPSLPSPLRTRLATALALDCLDAVRAAPSVARTLVVTSDPTVAEQALSAGAEVVVQPADDPGLGAAVRRGVEAAGGGPTAVLLADLPSVRPEDVDAALAAVAAACTDEGSWACVPDAAGDGTVMVAALRSAWLAPRFGPGSAAAHEAAGALRLPLDLPRLRRDVDVPSDLAEVVRLGVGPRTARTLADVQATVLEFDPATEGGSVVTDDGVRLALAPDALRGSGLRHLRPGQRVSCDAGADGRTVERVRIRGIEADPA